jgi:hypothetical protein
MERYVSQQRDIERHRFQFARGEAQPPCANDRAKDAEVLVMALKGLSAKVTAFFKLLEGMDDPIGNHISFLERRIDTLECDLHRLRRDQQPNFGSGAPERIKLRTGN